jgi:hypothetical protein
MTNKFTMLAIFSVVFSLLFTSCALEKRVHNSGFHMEWFGAKQHGPQVQAKKEKSKDNAAVFTPDSQENFALAPSETLSHDIDEAPVVTELSTLPALASATKTSGVKKAKVNKFQRFAVAKTHAALSALSFQKLLSQPMQESAPSNESGTTSGFAVAGFVLGLLGFLLVLITGWPFLMGTMAVIFSAIGLGDTNKGKSGKGMATAGLILGIVSIVLFWLTVIFLGLML